MLERGAEVAGGGRLALRAVYPPHQRRAFFGAKGRFLSASYNDSCPSMNIATGCQRYLCIAVASSLKLPHLRILQAYYNLPLPLPRFPLVQGRTGCMYNQLAAGSSFFERDDPNHRSLPAYLPIYLTLPSPFLSTLHPPSPPLPHPHPQHRDGTNTPSALSIYPPKLHIPPSLHPSLLTQRLFAQLIHVDRHREIGNREFALFSFF